MSKCQACNTEDAIWAWQPFGPNDRPDIFALLGWHYRGFPVVKLCDRCKDEAQGSAPIEFTMNGQKYIGNRDAVYAVPTYVGDPLLWWEETCGK